MLYIYQQYRHYVKTIFMFKQIELSIHERILNNVSLFPCIINVCFSNNIMRNVHWAVNQHIRMISEGSRDTEDWSNNPENAALSSQE